MSELNASFLCVHLDSFSLYSVKPLKVMEAILYTEVDRQCGTNFLVYKKTRDVTIETKPGVCFLKAPQLFGLISGMIIHTVSCKQRSF